MISIDALGPDGWARFRALRLAALAEAPAAFGSTYTSWKDAGEARWRARLRDVAFNAIAIVDGTEVGLVSGVDNAGGDPVELISLWVAPAARGKGVGDALVRVVIEWGAPRATRLNVYPANAPAIALYERNGFASLGVVGGELVMERR